MERNWKLYGWSDGNINHKKFYYSDFNHVKTSVNRFGYDFFYDEIYLCKESDTNCIYEMWDCVIKPNDIVVDLGANVGLFTRHAASIASTVIAVEGSPELYSCLVENTYDLQNVQCLNAIIEMEEGDSEMHHWTSKINPIYVDLEKIMEMYGLDHIDFLKCDIEGAEWGLFRNTQPSTIAKISKIALEPHNDKKGSNPWELFLPGKIRHDFTRKNEVTFYYVTQNFSYSK